MNKTAMHKTPNTPTVERTPAGYFQIARVITFPVEHLGYIDWSKLADTRAELGAEMHVTADGENGDGLRVTFGWPITEAEALPYLANANAADGGQVTP